MRTRHGYLLVETLTVVIATPALFLATAGIYVIFTQDVPRSIRAVQEDTACLDMIAHVRDDVAAARSVKLGADGHFPIIHIGDSVVSYELADGLMRRLARTAVEGEPVVTGSWRLPGLAVRWRRLPGAKAPALAVSTSIRQKTQGHVQDKFVNSHVFFARTPGQAVVE